MILPRAVLAAAACALLAGCTGDNLGGVQLGAGDNDPTTGAGTFDAQVSGLVTTSLEGSARFGTVVDPETGVALWVMNLVPAEGSVGGVHFVRRGPRPESGVSLGEIGAGGTLPASDVGGVFVDAAGVQIQAGFFSTSGTLDIDASSVDAMEGTFDFRANGYLVNPDGSVEQGEVRVSGRYDAIPGAVFVPPTR